MKHSTAKDEEFFKMNRTNQNEDSNKTSEDITLKDSSDKSYESKRQETFKISDLHLYVGNLSKKTDEESLANYFSRFGKIEDIHVPKNHENEIRGFGYITFASFKQESPLHQLHKIDGR